MHLKTAYEMGVQLALEEAGLVKGAFFGGALGSMMSGTGPQAGSFSGSGIGNAFKNFGQNVMGRLQSAMPKPMGFDIPRVQANY